MRYFITLLIMLSACGGSQHNNDDEYYESRGLTNQCTEKPGSCYPAGTYMDPESIERVYQASPYQETQDNYYPGKYVPREETDTIQPPYSFTNTQSGNTYTRFGHGWYIDSQGDTLRQFGPNSYIDDRGTMYMPFGNGLIDPEGNFFMGQ